MRSVLALRVRPTKRSSGTGTPWRFSTSPGRFYPGVGSGAPTVTSARSLAFSQLTPLWSRVRFRLSPWARLLRRKLASEHRRISRFARNTDVALGQHPPTSSLMARQPAGPATAGFDPRPLTFEPLGGRPPGTSHKPRARSSRSLFVAVSVCRDTSKKSMV